MKRIRIIERTLYTIMAMGITIVTLDFFNEFRVQTWLTDLFCGGTVGVCHWKIETIFGFFNSWGLIFYAIFSQKKYFFIHGQIVTLVVYFLLIRGAMYLVKWGFNAVIRTPKEKSKETHSTPDPSEIKVLKWLKIAQKTAFVLIFLVVLTVSLDFLSGFEFRSWLIKEFCGTNGGRCQQTLEDAFSCFHDMGSWLYGGFSENNFMFIVAQIITLTSYILVIWSVFYTARFAFSKISNWRSIKKS